MSNIREKVQKLYNNIACTSTRQPPLPAHSHTLQPVLAAATAFPTTALTNPTRSSHESSSSSPSPTTITSTDATGSTNLIPGRWIPPSPSDGSGKILEPPEYRLPSAFGRPPRSQAAPPRFVRSYEAPSSQQGHHQTDRELEGTSADEPPLPSNHIIQPFMQITPASFNPARAPSAIGRPLQPQASPETLPQVRDPPLPLTPILRPSTQPVANLPDPWDASPLGDGFEVDIGTIRMASLDNSTTPGNDSYVVSPPPLSAAAIALRDLTQVHGSSSTINRSTTLPSVAIQPGPSTAGQKATTPAEQDVDPASLCLSQSPTTSCIKAAAISAADYGVGVAGPGPSTLANAARRIETSRNAHSIVDGNTAIAAHSSVHNEFPSMETSLKGKARLQGPIRSPRLLTSSPSISSLEHTLQQPNREVGEEPITTCNTPGPNARNLGADATSTSSILAWSVISVHDSSTGKSKCTHRIPDIANYRGSSDVRPPEPYSEPEPPTHPLKNDKPPIPLYRIPIPPLPAETAPAHPPQSAEAPPSQQDDSGRDNHLVVRILVAIVAYLLEWAVNPVIMAWVRFQCWVTRRARMRRAGMGMV